MARRRPSAAQRAATTTLTRARRAAVPRAYAVPAVADGGRGRTITNPNTSRDPAVTVPLPEVVCVPDRRTVRSVLAVPADRNTRPRHPRSDLEIVLRLAEERQWEVSRGGKYYRCLCPCGEHLKWVHLTPSDPNYPRNLRAWFTRQDCWEELAR